MFNYDSRGVKPNTFSDPVPPGEYILQIMKAEALTSRSGYPMVKVTCRIDDGQYAGATIFNHVTFLPSGQPGAGIAIHFLKTIGEPWEEMENLDVDPERWIMRKFRANIIQEPYKKPDGTEIVTNKIKGVEPIGESDIQF